MSRTNDDVTIRGAELPSADLEDSDEIRIEGSRRVPLVPSSHMFRSHEVGTTCVHTKHCHKASQRRKSITG